MKIALPLCAGIKWLLLLKGSGKSNLWVFFFQSFVAPLHTSGAVLIIIISSTLPLCLWASFEQCFLFCALFQQAPAFLEVAAWALSQSEGMPASASIHFCFHYASFLQSFQINFTAFLNFKAYKKNLVLLTLVNWDLFRNLEDAFALVPGVAVPLPAFSGFLALSSPKTSGPFPSIFWVRGWSCALDVTVLSHAVLGQAIPAGQSWASHPCLHAQLAHSKKAQPKLVCSGEADKWFDFPMQSKKKN